jgi:hypothetical protein
LPNKLKEKTNKQQNKQNNQNGRHVLFGDWDISLSYKTVPVPSSIGKQTS